MAQIQGTIALCLTILLFSTLVNEIVGADFINYGALMRDGQKCLQRDGCQDQPANEYNRGCEASQRCRQDQGL